MMKKQIAGLVLAVSVVGGVGAGVLANALTTNTPAAANNNDKTPSDDPSDKPSTAAPTSPTTDAPTESVDAPTKPADLVITLGAVGPVKAGMSKEAALATGLFDADVLAAADGCPVQPLVWKKAFGDVVDVQTLGNGEVASIGIRGSGPRTKDGLGVGSTFGEVRKSIADSAAIEAGYGQAGVYDFDPQNGGWIGYLFDTTVDDIVDTDKVTFVEVTKGGQPGLMRDGC